MKWTIHNTLICPHSGVAFSYISGLRFLKYIIWYEADVLLLPGETVTLYSSAVEINGEYHFLKVYNMTIYSEEDWEKLRDRPSCPYNFESTSAEGCFYMPWCAIKRCPNKLKRNELCE